MVDYHSFSVSESTSNRDARVAALTRLSFHRFFMFPKACLEAQQA